jgi:hypothetical protein
MSKELYMYALPRDVERIIAELNEKLRVAILSPTSPNGKPSFIDSPIRKQSLLQSTESTSVRCCLVESGLADLKFKYYAELSAWHITDESEFISVSGCDFDGKVLVRGRFYCQTDMLRGNEIVSKRSEFVGWADRVFRLAKRSLKWSRELDAYVGPEACSWEKSGGRFASFAFPGQRIVFASRRLAPENDPLQTA